MARNDTAQQRASARYELAKAGSAPWPTDEDWKDDPKGTMIRMREMRKHHATMRMTMCATRVDEPVMVREARARADAARKRMTDSLGASAMAVSGEVTAILTKRS